MRGLVVLGTRPEFIKIFPIIKEMKKNNIQVDILNTNQHPDLLKISLNEKNIIPKYILKECKGELIDKKSEMLRQMDNILMNFHFSFIIVQGDTLSALVGAEYGFFHDIPVYHIEAGLRTYNINNPYPEELFRRIISLYAQKHFCPTEKEKNNLVKEGFSTDNIFVVGNTYIDYHKEEENECIKEKKQILLTIHRRENLKFIDKIFNDIKLVVNNTPSYTWIFPLHPNPVISKKANEILSDLNNMKLIQPLSPSDFYKELQSSTLIITDSGGVQEECIYNLKRTIILRKYTERETSFSFLKIIDPEEDNFFVEFKDLLEKEIEFNENDRWFYGNGNAAEKIVEIIKRG